MVNMNSSADHLELLQRLCNGALDRDLTVERFYQEIGDMTNFRGFSKVVVADLLDFLEHETDGQEWQKLDLKLSQELLGRDVSDVVKIDARKYLRAKLSTNRSVADQVDEFLKSRSSPSAPE